ncbi:NRDE family protein [Microbulbifer sp. Q7]|uniref:NRDE family protein n=1 Tax=Microbulbifer sp. Q7 TaxID=1785091 RepID=UPI0008319BF2|nr:NRDE family protein [Microbulbifer sp. Q7]
MCLLLIAYQQHPQYPLLLLANRDEFYRRPAAPAHAWPDREITAGRDLQAGGTWLGIAPTGRVAAVTNIREPGVPEPERVLSRGEIPTQFLCGDQPPQEYAAALPGARYRGFNAILFDHRHNNVLACAGNRHAPFTFSAGVHGISNGAPDAPWPKVRLGCQRLACLLETLPDRLDAHNFVAPALTLLTDDTPAEANQLPDTGVGPAMEAALSPIFVRIRDGDPAGTDHGLPGGYGTRASTLVAVDRFGSVQLWEQTYIDGQASGSPRYFHHSAG